jgi:hypothetical protein
MNKKSNRWNPKSRGKKGAKSTSGNKLASAHQCSTKHSIEPHEFAGAVLDIWRLATRVTDNSVPEPVQIAVERLSDRIRGMGFEARNLEGETYQQNMKVFVVDDLGGDEPKYILQCLTPAIYFKGTLIEPANVVIGGKCDGTTDS